MQLLRLLTIILLTAFSSSIFCQKLISEGDEIMLMLEGAEGPERIAINGVERELEFENGLAGTGELEEGLNFISVPRSGMHALYHLDLEADGTAVIKRIPLWLSILPPLIAIGLALLFKEVVVSLFAGIWVGAFIAGGLSPGNVLSAFLATIEEYIIAAVADPDHMAVIVFSLLIGGMVAIISKNGGMAGVVNALSRYARSARSSQLVTWFLGVAIFFDDYANTLIVGNTMRPVTDRFRVSREKLAYIVDSTAAPVAAVAFITTWIGAELGYIDDGIALLSQFPYDLTPYAIFIQSLKYSFYPLLTLVFILFLIYTGRDYGPMQRAELRARKTGQVSPAKTEAEDEPDMEDLSPVAGAPKRWTHAVIPILTVILVTIIGLIATGMDATYAQLREMGVPITSENWGAVWAGMSEGLDGRPSALRKLGTLVGNSNSFTALLWASFSGVVVALVITIGSGTMNLFRSMHAMVTGFKTMIPAVLILTLAWSLAITTEQLHTADFLSALLQDNISPVILPMIVFVMAALISFSTGSSWSTMAILYPIAIPTTWAVCMAAGLEPDYSFEILLNVIATVLAASVLGDHCSPISDTTILSSLASDCNHIDHVQTQMPYALTVGAVALALCGLSALLGGGWGLNLVLLIAGLAILWLVVNKFGKPAV